MKTILLLSALLLISNSLKAASDNAISKNQSCDPSPTTAINPKTGSEVEFPTKCDVPSNWNIVSESNLIISDIKSKGSKLLKDTGSLISDTWDGSEEERGKIKSQLIDVTKDVNVYLTDSIGDASDTAIEAYNEFNSNDKVKDAKSSINKGWNSFTDFFSDSKNEDKSGKED
jgi:hypothetical protein